MLEHQNASEPIYFGCKFKPYVKQGYMSGGAGYVLSKEALRRFATRGLGDKTGVICRSDGGGAEDVEMGKCMENLGVRAGDSRYKGSHSIGNLYLIISGTLLAVAASSPSSLSTT